MFADPYQEHVLSEALIMVNERLLERLVIWHKLYCFFSSYYQFNVCSSFVISTIWLIWDFQEKTIAASWSKS